MKTKKCVFQLQMIKLSKKFLIGVFTHFFLLLNSGCTQIDNKNSHHNDIIWRQPRKEFSHYIHSAWWINLEEEIYEIFSSIGENTHFVNISFGFVLYDLFRKEYKRKIYHILYLLSHKCNKIMEESKLLSLPITFFNGTLSNI